MKLDQARLRGRAHLDRLFRHLLGRDLGPYRGMSGAEPPPSALPHASADESPTSAPDSAEPAELPARIPSELSRFLEQAASRRAGDASEFTWVAPEEPPAAPLRLLSRWRAKSEPAALAPTRQTHTARAVALAAVTTVVGLLLVSDGDSPPGRPAPDLPGQRWNFLGGEATRAAAQAAMARVTLASPRPAAVARPEPSAPEAAATPERLAFGPSLAAPAAPPASPEPQWSRQAPASEAAQPVAGPVIVRDLPPGTTLSVGTRLSNGVWLLEASELGNVVITLPSDAPDQFRATIAPQAGGEASPGINLQVRRTARLDPSSSGPSEASAIPRGVSAGPAKAAPDLPPGPFVPPAKSPPDHAADAPPGPVAPAAGDEPARRPPHAAAKKKNRPPVASAPPARTAGAGQGAGKSPVAMRRPKASGPKPVHQPHPDGAVPYPATIAKAPVKPKVQGPPPTASASAAPPGPPAGPPGSTPLPSTLGGPPLPPPPPPPGPGWLLQFLQPE